MPKDKHPPAFPLYVDDFISDSAVDAMTNQELGIYVRFLCKAWKEEPPGTIPGDDAILAGWSKESRKTWQRCRAGVLRAFRLGDDGRFHQKRMKLEWEKRVEYHKAKAAAGAKGGKAKANGKHSYDPASSESEANPSVSLSSSFSHSSSGDGNGAIDFSFLEDTRAREMAGKLAGWVICRDMESFKLVTKVAMLYGNRELSDDDLEQVLESFRVTSGKIDNPAGWLRQCLRGRNRAFEDLLAATVMPLGASLEAPR